MIKIKPNFHSLWFSFPDHIKYHSLKALYTALGGAAEMKRVILLLLGLAFAGCTARVDTVGAPRPELLRDVEGYAIAVCLFNQTQPYLKDQGDAWASVIVQRMRGNPNVLAGVAEQVKRENAKGEMAVIRDETGPDKDKILPLLYCYEIIDRPSVRAAIQKAVATLKPSYGR